ncbi:MAG: DHCW motif cupin fold protein [Chitinophagaceae bacterium]|nr:DHCW motif cupin fold protein [Chitinophagaceae bacterium]
MNIPSFSFSITDFSTIDPEIHQGLTGFAEWRILQKNDIRIRLVQYSDDYLADHWCNKGHIIFCVEGEMETELATGEKHLLKKGHLYTVGDNADAHRSYSKNGCTLFIVD